MIRPKILALTLLLAACSGRENDHVAINNDQVSSSAKTAKLLPVTLTHAYITNAFKDQLKVATVIASTENSSKDDWVATGIVLAEQLAKNGFDVVDVTLDRNDLGSVHAVNMFKHYARVQYAPNLKRSFDFEQNWLISVADNVVPIKMIEASNEYENQYRKFLDQGNNDASADKKAAAIVTKKFELESGWKLPEGGLADTKLGRNDFLIKNEPADLISIERIVVCLKNKMNTTIKTCN